MSRAALRSDPTALSPREQQVLDFMLAYLTENGCLPTNQETADALNVSRRTVEAHCARLGQKGALVNRGSGTRRGVSLAHLTCPHCGKPMAAPKEDSA